MIALLFAAALLAEVTEADIEAYAERSRRERPKQIALYKKDIVKVRRDRTLAPDDKKKRIADIDLKVTKLKNRSVPHYPILPCNLYEPIDGAIGHVNQFVDIVQVWDAGSALVEAKLWVPGARTGRPINLKTARYTLKGFPTQGMVDGEDYRVLGVVKIGGRETFDDTDGGTTTVRILERVPVEQHANKFKAAPATSR